MSNKQQPRRQKSKQPNNNNNNNNRNAKKQMPKLSRAQQVFNAQGDPRASPMSPQIRDYAHALANPFEASPAGVPVFPVVASQKVKCFFKEFIVTSSTTGQGYIAVRPASIVANDADGVIYTDNTWAGATIAATGTGVLLGRTNSPFTTTNFSTDETQYRLVSVGIRYRFAGIVLDRGGIGLPRVAPEVVTVEEPT